MYPLLVGKSPWDTGHRPSSLAKITWAGTTRPCDLLRNYQEIYIYIYRRLGGVRSPLGRPPRNREIVSCRACVRAVDCQVEMSPNRKTGAFPFSLWAGDPFPFPFVTGILSLFPCEIMCSLCLEITEIKGIQVRSSESK